MRLYAVLYRPQCRLHFPHVASINRQTDRLTDCASNLERILSRLLRMFALVIELPAECSLLI